VLFKIAQAHESPAATLDAVLERFPLLGGARTSGVIGPSGCCSISDDCLDRLEPREPLAGAPRALGLLYPGAWYSTALSG